MNNKSFIAFRPTYLRYLSQKKQIRLFSSCVAGKSLSLSNVGRSVTSFNCPVLQTPYLNPLFKFWFSYGYSSALPTILLNVYDLKTIQSVWFSNSNPILGSGVFAPQGNTRRRFLTPLLQTLRTRSPLLRREASFPRADQAILLRHTNARLWGSFGIINSPTFRLVGSCFLPKFNPNSIYSLEISNVVKRWSRSKRKSRNFWKFADYPTRSKWSKVSNRLLTSRLSKVLESRGVSIYPSSGFEKALSNRHSHRYLLRFRKPVRDIKSGVEDLTTPYMYLPTLSTNLDKLLPKLRTSPTLSLFFNLAKRGFVSRRSSSLVETASFSSIPNLRFIPTVGLGANSLSSYVPVRLNHFSSSQLVRFHRGSTFGIFPYTDSSDLLLPEPKQQARRRRRLKARRVYEKPANTNIATMRKCFILSLLRDTVSRAQLSIKEGEGSGIKRTLAWRRNNIRRLEKIFQRSLARILKFTKTKKSTQSSNKRRRSRVKKQPSSITHKVFVSRNSWFSRLSSIRHESEHSKKYNSLTNTYPTKLLKMLNLDPVFSSRLNSLAIRAILRGRRLSRFDLRARVFKHAFFRALLLTTLHYSDLTVEPTTGFNRSNLIEFRAHFKGYLAEQLPRYSAGKLSRIIPSKYLLSLVSYINRFVLSLSARRQVLLQRGGVGTWSRSFSKAWSHRGSFLSSLVPKPKLYRLHWNLKRRRSGLFNPGLKPRQPLLLNFLSDKKLPNLIKRVAGPNVLLSPQLGKVTKFRDFSNSRRFFVFSHPKTKRSAFGFLGRKDRLVRAAPRFFFSTHSHFKAWSNRYLNSTKIYPPSSASLWPLFYGVNSIDWFDWSEPSLKPGFSSFDRLQTEYKYLVPEISPLFRRAIPFMSQLLSVLTFLPEYWARENTFHLGCDPFEFINFKQVKKSLFRRLITKKNRMLRWKSRQVASAVDVKHRYSWSLTKTQNALPTPNSSSSVLRTLMLPSLYDESAFGDLALHKGDVLRHGVTPVIRKTRFKPGYPRIWRAERRIIKQVTGLTQRYQYRLTLKLQKLFFAVRSQGYHKGAPLLRLGHSVILSHLAPDNCTANIFFNEGYIYLNGLRAKNSRTILFRNDFIQLIISLRFYVLIKWIRGWSENRFKKWTQRYYRTYRVKRQLFREFKFRELPDSVLTLENSWYDIPKFYEVDFFTLSSFVLMNTYGEHVRHPSSNEYADLKIFNMYNWKYIT